MKKGMKKKAYKKQRKRVLKEFRKWQPLIIPSWGVTYLWSDRWPKRKSASVAVECQADWRYRNVVYTCYLPVLALLVDHELELTIIHELVHPHLDELVQQRKEKDFLDHLEHVTQNLAMAIRYMSQRDEA